MKSKLLLCALAFALLCGCWDKQELEDHIFVIMMGIDKAQDGNLLVTVAYPVTQMGPGGGEGPGEYAVISAKAPTLSQAMSLFGINLAGPLSLFSAKTIVISEELARDDMLRDVFSQGYYDQMRNNTSVVIANSGAAAFIKARIENPAIDPLRQEDLLLEQANYSAYYRPMQLLDFTRSLRASNMDAAAIYAGVAQESADQKDEEKSKENAQEDQPQSEPDDAQISQPVRAGYLPGQAPLLGDNSAQISGLAVFRGERMVGALDSFETQTLNLITRSRTRKILALPDPLSPGEEMIVSILPTGRSKIRSYFVGETPTFDITLRLRGTIEQIRGDANHSEDFLAAYIKQACASNIENLITKLQQEYRADLLGLGSKLSRNFLTVQEWEAFGWRERYPDANIRVHINLDLDRADIGGSGSRVLF